jgi:hypothetical protein
LLQPGLHAIETGIGPAPLDFHDVNLAAVIPGNLPRPQQPLIA